MDDKINTFTSLVIQHDTNKVEVIRMAEQQKEIICQAVIDSNKDLQQAWI